MTREVNRGAERSLATNYFLSLTFTASGYYQRDSMGLNPTGTYELLHINGMSAAILDRGSLTTRGYYTCSGTNLMTLVDANNAQAFPTNLNDPHTLLIRYWTRR